jgi:hypothetical protein
MSKIKTKVSGVERYKIFKEGGARKMVRENNKMLLTYNKLLTIQEEFSPMFKERVKEILSHIENYTSTLECQLCRKRIEDTMTPNYFHLYPEGQTIFITFHFLCALKQHVVLEFQDKMDDFDYIARIKD